MSRTVTAIAFYILMCLMFVFTATIEYAFLLYHMRHRKGKAFDRKKVGVRQQSDNDIDAKQSHFFATVDKMTFAVSTITFILFVLSYFSYYLLSRNCQN